MGASGRSGSFLLSTVVAVALAVLLHVSLAADPVSAVIPPTVAPKYLVPRGRSSPQVTELPGAKTTKGAKAVLVKGTPTGGPTTPWRPPVVNLNYLGGLVMNKPIRIHFIWYACMPSAHHDNPTHSTIVSDVFENGLSESMDSCAISGTFSSLGKLFQNL